MGQDGALSPKDFERLRNYDTCTVSNAIERFNLRLRNEGFVNSSVRCLFPQFPPMLGYAVTGRIRSSFPPMTGGWYFDRMDWWSHILTIPAPRVVVLQDVDRTPGVGALVGEVHANICRALDCVGYVTNGAVRDVAAVEKTGFHLFAACVAVSHAYAHIVEFGEPVEIGGLRIKPGDLLHGDRHGVHVIPKPIAAEIPRVADELLAHERELIEFCRSSDFSLDKLSSMIHQTSLQDHPSEAGDTRRKRT